jgi:membrane associated rhomboid family serine protease
MEESPKHKLTEKRKLFHSVVFPLFLLLLMFSVLLIESVENDNWYWLGIKPLSVEGLMGIVTMPFKHAGWNHLLNNAPSFLVLSVAMFYFYRPIGYKVFFTIWFLSTTGLWLLARDAWHVGASGLIYGLASFLFVSGVHRRHIPLMAISMLVVFLYGSMVWGIFPMPQFRNQSWEGHYWGMLAGVITAFLYRNQGPQKPLPQWEEPEESEDENPYWQVGETKNEK